MYNLNTLHGCVLVQERLHDQKKQLNTKNKRVNR